MAKPLKQGNTHMANITLIQNTAGINASAGRQLLGSNSWTRFDVTFITPDGDEFHIPAGSNIVGELNKQAIAKGIKIDAVDFLGQFEKTYNMKLKDAELLDSKARNAKLGAPELEYDNLVISMDSQASSDPDIAKQINNIIIDELRSVKCALTDDKIGYEGKRPIFVSDEHTNTGNKHTHIILHRFGQGVDPLTKRPYMSTGVMMDSNSVMATLEKRINDRLNVAGLTQFTFSATGSNTRVADNNEISRVAKSATEELIIAAGGAINAATVVVPEAKQMQAQSILFKSEAEELNRQIEKIRMQAVAKVEAAAKLDQAIQVMTENDQLKTDLQVLQGELKDTNTELAATKEQAEQTIAEKQLHINFVGDALSSFAPEVAEKMRAGDATAINGTLKTVTSRLSELDQAFDQLPEDIANKLRANPFEEFQNIVEDLDSQKSAVAELILKLEQATSSNTELTTRNQTLTVSTNTLTKQNREL